MPISRLLLMRQRRHGSNKEKEGSPNSPLTPGSPDYKGQRFFGTNMTNLKKRSHNGTAGDHVSYGTKSAGKHKQSKTGAQTFLNPSTVVIILSCSIASFSYILYEIDLYFNGSYYSNFVKSDLSGGWRIADDNINRKYGTEVCDVDRKWSHELTSEEFEKLYRYKKPVIVKFKNGAKDWTEPTKWKVSNLKREYGDWSVMSGNSREIVRRGGTGDIETSFSDFVDKVMKRGERTEEPYYVFDRHFYGDTSLPSSFTLPSYFQVKDGTDDSIFFMGSSSSGVSFHKHADAWNGVVYGRKRWFLYPIEKTPPGGVYPGFTTLEWFDQILPHLAEADKPMQCIQEPGDIMYLPEGIYHATINLGDTVAVGIQKKVSFTKAEKLFYEENEIAKMLGKVADSEEKNTLLKRKKKIYETLLDLLPDNSEIQMKVGQMYKEQGDLDRALKHTEIALDLDRYFIVAMLNQADTHSQLGHVDRADHLYKQALAMNPRLWDVYALYGDFLINHNQLQEAASMYRKGVELEPTSLVFRTRLKLAQERAGDLQDAEQTQRDIDRLQRDYR